MDTEFKYRPFIRYSHADEEWAKWLHRALETYRVPKHLVGRETESGPVPERIAPVFRDRDELATATNLGDHAGAEPLLLESQAGLEQSPIPRMAERGRIRVVELYTAWGRPEQARKYGGTK
jgi:hypothetical protein